MLRSQVRLLPSQPQLSMEKGITVARKRVIIDTPPCGPKCGDCPHAAESRGYVPPILNENSLYVVLGGNARYTDTLEGTPFAGKAGGSLNAKLALAGLSRLDVSMVDAVRCRPIQYERCDACAGDGATLGEVLELEFEYGILEQPTFDPCLECAGTGSLPSRQHDSDFKTIDPSPNQIIECMKRYGHDTLNALEAKRLIIAAGAPALFALTGRDNIGDYRGSVIDTTHGRVLATYDPVWVARGSQHMEPIMRRDFARIPAIVSETENVGLDYNYVKEPDSALVTDIEALRTVVMDLETTGGLDPLKGGDILMAGVSRRPGEGIILPTGEILERVLAALDEVVGQNFYSYDAWWLHNRSYTVPQVIVDTKVLAHLANPHTPNDLYFIQSEYAEPPMPGYWKERENYEADLEQVCMLDVDATKRSELGLVAYLKREGQWELAEHCIIPWTRLGFELRVYGIRADVGGLLENAERISADVFERGRALSESSGVALPAKTKTGIPSPQAIKKHLYTTLGLPPQRHPKTQKVTTDEPRLKRLYRWCQRHSRNDGLAFISALIGTPDPDTGDFEGGLKRKSTMAKDMRKFAKPGQGEDGRIIQPIIYIHAEPKLTGTLTGRLSYELLHQVPPYCKPAFLPDEGHVFLQFDYKQLELLVMLFHAQEWKLLRRAIDEGLDFHTMTASDFHGIPYEEVTPLQRKKIKPISLGRLYGKGVDSTALDLEIPVNNVRSIYKRYDEIIPGLARHQAREVERVERKGYIQTEYGWRRYFTREERYNAQRKSVKTEIYNTRIQSNAGIRAREAIVEIWRELKARYGEGRGVDARVVLTVHDSGLLSVDPSVLQDVIEIVERIATAPARCLRAPLADYPDGIPFPIDIEVGPNWGEMKTWTKDDSGTWAPKKLYLGTPQPTGVITC